MFLCLCYICFFLPNLKETKKRVSVCGCALSIKQNIFIIIISSNSISARVHCEAFLHPIAVTSTSSACA